jgi:hypothetical protein
MMISGIIFCVRCGTPWRKLEGTSGMILEAKTGTDVLCFLWGTVAGWFRLSNTKISVREPMVRFSWLEQ